MNSNFIYDCSINLIIKIIFIKQQYKTSQMDFIDYSFKYLSIRKRTRRTNLHIYKHK